MLKILALTGALVLIATVDGVISGTVSAVWGDWWGCRVDHVAIGIIGVIAVCGWADRRVG